jgi:hypothetical protein
LRNVNQNKSLIVVGGQTADAFDPLEGGMGTVITFPESRRYGDCRVSLDRNEPATIIILPVVRIERYVDAPKDSGSGDRPSSPRKRRRRTSRS